MHKFFTNTLFVGKKVIYLPTCHSTNDIASEYISKGEAYEGLLIVTSYQTAGRGQRGNQWNSLPDTNLMFSLVLRPHFLRISRQFYLNIAIALGIHDALGQILPAHFWIKWSNDLIFKDKKLGGILIENTIKSERLEYSIIGIGLNINQLAFDIPTATSLALAKGRTFELPSLLENICQALEARYLQLRQGQYDLLKTNYLERLYGYQELRKFEDLRSNAVQPFFQGQILGIDQEGRLAVEIERKIHFFNFKEIRFIFD